MKTFLVSTVIATLVSVASLFGAESPTQPGQASSTVVAPSKTPEGISASDWSGIRGAYERNRHAIAANPDGTHQARNPGQAWLTKFDGRGFTVTPDAGGWSWGLELAGYGEVTEVRQDGGRISYVRGDGVTEWFINDTRGLEQGWTLARRPERGDATGPIRLNLAVRGSLRPQVSGEGASVAFLDESSGTALTYGGLKAWDADGKTVHARFAEGEVEGMGLCVMVDDSNARYPVTIDPVAQQAYLKASNTATDDRFGSCVAISGDTVAISAQYEDSNATGVNGIQTNNYMTNSGAVYVFVRSGTTWIQQAYLKASNTGFYDQFGTFLAISGDTIVTGAHGEASESTGVNGSQTSNNASEAGAAYVFVRSGTTWSQQAYLKASNTGAGDLFHSVAIDGNTIVVGARREDSSSTGVNGNQADNSATDSGAAYVFVRNGTTWSQQAYLKASNTGAGDEFGWGVAVSGDTIAVSAGGEDSGATGVNGNQADNSVVNSGALYVFVRNGTTWSQEAYIKPLNTGTEDWFGGPVAISGNTIAAAARGDDSRASGINGDANDNWVAGAGSVHVFVRNGSTWSQQAYIKASNPDLGDDFGSSLGLSNNTLVVGCWQEDSAASGVNGDQSNNGAGDSGAAYVFIRHGSTWVQRAYLKASNSEAGDWFGYSVSVSGDTVVVSSQLEGSSATGVNGAQTNNGALASGAAYIFTGFEMASLEVSQPINGSITGNGNYEFGSAAMVTATPNPGYVFTGWSGAASGTTTPLSLIMDANKTVGATFSPDLSDNDTDGLTAFDEVVTYGTDPTKEDTDGDGLKDGWEVGVGRFSIIAGSFTWEQARADAHTRGGELACFPTADRWNRAMESFGANALDSYTGLWIGASDASTEGTWTWVNGEIFAYTNWGTGSPVTTPGNTSDYVEVCGGNGGEIGKWFDRSPTFARDGYILEIGYATDPKVADTDADGLTDGQEVNLTHTNPKLADSNGNGTNDAAEDSDNDGLSNLAEVTLYGTNPLLDDTDDDGIKDGAEINYAGSFYKLVQGSFTYPQAVANATAKRGRVASFPDAAEYERMAAKARLTTQGFLWIGLSDAATEGTWVWTNGTTATYARWLTGQPDGSAAESYVAIAENSTQWADAANNYVAAGYIFERVGLDPLDPDTDADGLTDGQEINITHTNPLLDDTDGDDLLDGAEVNTHGSSPLLVDTDADGINDRVEVEVYHTNPSLKDTDGDGFDDLFEVNTGFNPALASSTPDALSTIRTSVEFRFNAANGVSYRIEASADLTLWDTIEPVIIGQSAVVTRFYSTENQPKRYFRVRRN